MVTSTWFTLPLHLPFIALTFAAFMRNGCEIIFFKKIKQITCFFVWLSLGIFLFLTPIFWQRAKVFSTTVNSWVASKMISMPLTQLQIEKYGHGEGVHLATYMDMLRTSMKPYLTKDTLEIYKMCLLACEKTKNPSLMTHIAVLNAYDFLATQQLSMVSRLKWQERLLHILKQAPTRTDLAAPYLSHMILENNVSQAYVILDAIKNPLNPVKLWFLGLIDFQNYRREKGVDLMKQALELGLGRWIAIDQNFEKLIRTSGTRCKG